MDFVRVLESVCGFLEKRGFRYAVIGGLGVAAYRGIRITSTRMRTRPVTSYGCRLGAVSPVTALGWGFPLLSD